MIVPLRYELRNGDTVEILTSPNQKPTKDWLKFVVTSRARTKIRHFIRMEQRERSRQLGRDLLERELRKEDFSLADGGARGLAGRRRDSACAWATPTSCWWRSATARSTWRTPPTPC